MKPCSKCEEVKPLEEFAINSKGLHGRKSVCKVCSNDAQKKLAAKRKAEDPEAWSKYRRDKHLRSKYGMTQEDYEDMAEAQKGECAICNKTATLYIDHCHNSEEVRGLLCQQCNTLLGMAYDNIDTLKSAIEYLGGEDG